MSIIRRRNHEVPSLNTASLPDLIFAILFFFMYILYKNSILVDLLFCRKMF